MPNESCLALVSRLMNRFGPDFRIFGGLESTAFPMSALGACGTMITTSNVVPKQMACLNDLCIAGKLHEAQKLALGAHVDTHNIRIMLTSSTSPKKCKNFLLQLSSMPTKSW